MFVLKNLAIFSPRPVQREKWTVNSTKWRFHRGLYAHFSVTFLRLMSTIKLDSTPALFNCTRCSDSSNVVICQLSSYHFPALPCGASFSSPVVEFVLIHWTTNSYKTECALIVFVFWSPVFRSCKFSAPSPTLRKLIPNTEQCMSKWAIRVPKLRDWIFEVGQCWQCAWNCLEASVNFCNSKKRENV